MEDIYLDIFNKINKLKSQSGGQRWNLICIDICDLYFIYIKDQKDILYTTDELWNFLFNSCTLHGPEYTKFINACTNNKANSDFFSLIVIKAIDDPPASWWNTLFKPA